MLQALQQRVDSATNSFEPEDGLLAQVETSKIFDRYDIFRFFEKESYKYFLNVLGGKESFRKRLATLETTGRDADQLYVDLKGMGIRFSRVADSVFDRKFIVAKAGEVVPMIRIRVGELFSDEKSHRLQDVVRKSSELGLDFPPSELVVDMLIKMKNEWKTASKPLIIYSDWDLMRYVTFFSDCDNRETDIMDKWIMKNDDIAADTEFVFAVHKSQQ
jgi:hypothetical protein